MRREYVRDDHLSGKQIVMITIDGRAKTVPTAKITINTPYYKGEIEAVVPKSLIRREPKLRKLSNQSTS
jgi:hypothetical protein